MFKKLLISGVLFFAAAHSLVVHAQLSGSYSVGSGQTYTTLTGAGGFFAAVNSNGLSGNVTVSITSDLSESGSISLNQWTEIGIGGYTITIQPSGAIERIISGNPSGGLIKLDGADRVIFDGRFSGSGKYLRFRNTHNLGAAFIFLNDATNNTITYCIVESQNSSSTSGTIFFGTTIGTQGNDNNTISYTDIRDRSDDSGSPANAIYSLGSTLTSACANSGISILNNNIYNFFKNTAVANGIYLLTGTTDWTISGNSFYQTVVRLTAANTGFNPIFVSNSSGNNFIFAGNYIGGSAPNAGGAPWTMNTVGINVSNFVYAIRFGPAGTTTASSVQGNTIANFLIETNPISSDVVWFAGVLVEAGSVNIGNIIPNTIGSVSGTGSISISFGNANRTALVRGIDFRGLAGTIQGNLIGSISVGGDLADIMTFEGISTSSTPSSPVNILNNTIGSTVTANSIQITSASMPSVMYGINCIFNTQNTSISGNTVANLSNSCTQSVSAAYGILHRGSGSPSISNNIVHDISSATTNVSNIGVLGIASTSPSSSQVIEGNLIYALRSTTVGTGNTNVSGIQVDGLSGSGIINKNRIYDLTNTSTGTGPSIFGLNAFSGRWTASNNQITITNGELTDLIIAPNNLANRTEENNRPANLHPSVISNYPGVVIEEDLQTNNEPQNTGMVLADIPMPRVQSKTYGSMVEDAFSNAVIIQGIHDESGGICNYYYNSVYLGGTASGSSNSYCYVRQSFASTVTFRNNLFFNARTGGSGSHYAIGNTLGTPSSGWSSSASNYNVLVSSNPARIGEWGTGVGRTIDEWRTSSGGDKQSWSTASGSLSPTNLFTSILNGNLNIQTGNSEAWIVSGKGIAVSSQSSDFAGETRPTAIAQGVSDIGSDEFTATPPSNPVAVESGSPGPGATTTYTLFGRTIVSIDWGMGGTSYPAGVNINYYSGVNPTNVPVGSHYSNSNWLVQMTAGSLSGATYDITYYFGDNETYTIINPPTDTRLAKYDSGSWVAFAIAGTGSGESDLNWANLTIKTRGLNSFSEFALTDSDNPLPVILSFFGASVSGREVELKWITESEMNNRGFEIQRRNETGKGYSEWSSLSFVDGLGNSNSQHVYKYTDKKLNSGNYQYLLKQFDYNGNCEYFSLRTPSDVIIDKPVSFNMTQNYPNPSNPASKIDYQLPFDAKVTIKIYDLTGREVSSLIDEFKQTGYHTVEFNGYDLASGIYFYRITIASSEGSYGKTMKLVLLR